MTHDYGEQLATAAAAIAQASAALRDPPPDPAARASAALSRARLYRSLKHQVVAVGQVYMRDWPPIGNPHPAERLVLLLGQAFRHTTIAEMQPNRGGLEPAGPVANALHKAYQALQTAGDILISNTGSPTVPAANHRPLTTEGMALLAGVGREDNLAALARLAVAATDMDATFCTWLDPANAPADLQPLLEAAADDAWHTSRRAQQIPHRIAAAGDPGHAPALGMRIGPPVDDPRLWTNPTSGTDCVAAFDAARSWLVRHSDELTVQQLASTAHAVHAITHYLGHIQAHTAQPDITGPAADAAQPWQAVRRVAGELRSPVLRQDAHSTLAVALGGVALWLRAQLRPAGQWRHPSRWAPDPAARSAWRETAGQLAARMPDLADLFRKAVDTVYARGGVLAATGQLSKQPGKLIHICTQQWHPAPPGHPTHRELRAALSLAATNARALAQAMDIPPRPGLADLRATSQPTDGTSPNPAKLAEQWYLRQGGMVEPTRPAPTDTTRTNRQQLPGRGLVW